MGHRALAGICLVVALLSTGCVGAIIESARAPDADLTPLRSFYVQKFERDGRGLEKLLSDRLNAMGYRSSYGVADLPLEPVDAVVTYQDRWMWDLTMYMIQLSVQVRDPHTRMILAKGQSFRPSLYRASPEAMVEEILRDIFGERRP